MAVTTVERQQIATNGFAFLSERQKFKTYWTPSGKEVRLTENNVENNTGMRDRNLDSGVLPYKPEHLMLDCPHCLKWHKTQKEVTDCGKQKATNARQWELKASKLRRQDKAGSDERIGKLETDMAGLNNKLDAILAKLGGK